MSSGETGWGVRGDQTNGFMVSCRQEGLVLADVVSRVQ